MSGRHLLTSHFYCTTYYYIDTTTDHYLSASSTGLCAPRRQRRPLRHHCLLHGPLQSTRIGELNWCESNEK